jgi:type I restriction enzyme S subunit
MKYQRIGQLTSVITGGTPSTQIKDYWDGGTIPWLQSGCCQNCEVSEPSNLITEKGLENSSAKIMPKDSVLIALTGATAGKVGFLTFPAAGNQSITGIVPSKAIDQKFLFYYLMSIRDQVLNDCNGGAQPHISQKYVKNILFPVLSLADQEKMADELETIVNQKKDLQKLAESCEELVKSKFNELFLEKIEAGPKKPLGSISSMVTVGIANSATQAYSNDGVVMLRNQNIKEDYVDDTELIKIKPEFAEKYRGKALRKDDILVIRTGYPGVACLVPERFEGCQTFTTLIVRLKLNKTINPRFVCHYINSKFGKDFVDSNKIGIAQQNFGAKQLAKMPIFLPRKEDQDAYIVFVEKVDKLKANIHKEIDLANELMALKFHQYFDQEA